MLCLCLLGKDASQPLSIKAGLTDLQHSVCDGQTLCRDKLGTPGWKTMLQRVECNFARRKARQTGKQIQENDELTKQLFYQ